MSGDGNDVQPLVAARSDGFCEVFGFVHAREGYPVNLSGYPVAVMQVRQYQGAPGAAPISLTNVASAADEGLFLVDAVAGLMQVRINRSTLEGMAGRHQPKAGAAQRFFYDIIFQATDGFVWKAAEGEFILAPGVTILP